jgi:hypothetical protein
MTLYLLSYDVSSLNYKTFNRLLSWGFVTVSHFYPSLIFAGKKGAYPTELLGCDISSLNYTTLNRIIT